MPRNRLNCVLEERSLGDMALASRERKHPPIAMLFPSVQSTPQQTCTVFLSTRSSLSLAPPPPHIPGPAAPAGRRLLQVVDHQRLSGAGYCYSAAAPPFTSAAASVALRMLRAEPELISSLRANAEFLHKAVGAIPGLKVGFCAPIRANWLGWVGSDCMISVGLERNCYLLS